MQRTLHIDDFDAAEQMYTGTIIVDGEMMRVWVSDDMANEAMDLAAETEAEGRDEPRASGQRSGLARLSQQDVAPCPSEARTPT